MLAALAGNLGNRAMRALDGIEDEEPVVIGELGLRAERPAAVALADLLRRCAPLPFVGVVEPAARAACAATRTGRIAVIATEGTVRAGAYEAAIRRIRPDAAVVSTACPLFVVIRTTPFAARAP